MFSKGKRAFLIQILNILSEIEGFEPSLVTIHFRLLMSPLRNSFLASLARSKYSAVFSNSNCILSLLLFPVISSFAFSFASSLFLF
ncbi:MAG: hypothetical protein A2312_03455 [Candidatus Staskawiczbacteria bacterium RIFOXYB2_FULL_32_9]|uniref:Uncharacterized protein n=1 Tax=Candidatus Staskawiczbacteria bacterium RIFOXYD1_FULL_32_13 TaxID=1802234 RepID=A0A1G2JPI2_9BACT|nr:MAG: hypothetical protein A2256_03135 [Candidatus Staskawiczbacteria bacterium RIFOXYA2_FULL_32_7]OGZ83316.1 MAG: hypothetical protein A2312_03455 [Candidatus Staskawiczbacteria bacterium RIFOXYB2_FULL_32_9]OGZ88371.1 MAG: hypothetical protein A2561_02110 [Candidatus Staskawiczbacteria bacterium RIFOXYD1_FULL_32_13]